MLAAAGVNWYGSPEQASAMMAPKPEAAVQPDSRLIRPYAQLNAVYRQYYKTIQPLQTALSDARS